MVCPKSPGLARNLEVRGGRDAAAPRLRISRPDTLRSGAGRRPNGPAGWLEPNLNTDGQTRIIDPQSWEVRGEIISIGVVGVFQISFLLLHEMKQTKGQSCSIHHYLTRRTRLSLTIA